MATRVAGHVRMPARERREQLLDVAKEIVAEQGFHAVTIEAVTRRAGITRPVVYSHFPDLTALLETLVERETARAREQLARVVPTDLTGGGEREALLAALDGYLEAVEADPVTWRLALMPPEGAPEVLRERIAEGRSMAIGQLAAAVGPDFGAARASPDPELTARMLSALADEAARLLLTDRRRYTRGRIRSHARWLLEQLAPLTPPQPASSSARSRSNPG